MAKRRNLKRDIGYVAGELFTEVLVAKMLTPGINHDKADELLGAILDMQDEFVQRASNPTGKDNPKLVREYYKKLEADLQQAIDDIVSKIQALGKDNQNA